MSFCHCICNLVFHMLFPSISMAVIDNTCITSVSEYSKSIRLLFKWINVPSYGVLYYFTAQVTYVTLRIPINVQDKVSNTTCLYLFAYWHRFMYFVLLWLFCLRSNSKHKLPLTLFSFIETSHIVKIIFMESAIYK